MRTHTSAGWQQLIQRRLKRSIAVLIAITAVLVTIGLFACWLPARRATRIAPTEAQRAE